MKSSRLLEFDVLRVAAMLYVVGFFHLSPYFPPLRGIAKIPIFNTLTCVALGAFVFISAYLLASRSAVDSWNDVKTFLNRRFWRVYPLFFLTLVAFLLRSSISLAQFVGGALLLTMLTGRTIQTLWFVTMLFLFYLLTPLYLWKGSLRKTALLTLILACFFIAVEAIIGRIDLRLPMYLLIFGLGIATAQEPRLWASFFNKGLISAGVVIFALISYFVVGNKTQSHPKNAAEIVAIVLAIVSLLPFLLAVSRVAAQFIPKTLLLALSYGSFSMYLLHRLTYRPLLNLYEPQTVPHMLLYAAFVMIPVTFLLAFWVQKLYDAALTRFFPTPKAS
jgi:peptidoglycan/LPS O-acetylase OafA/YrhL